MIRPARALGAVFVLAASLWPTPSPAGLVVAGRGGMAAPVHGDLVDDLDLDIGPGYGLTVGLEVWEMLSIELRADGLWLFGGPSFSTTETTPQGVASFQLDADVTSMTHAVTVGPAITFRHEAAEVVVGFHPGVYLTDVSMDLAGTATLPRAGTRDGRGEADSDLAADFGFQAALGARVFLSESLFLGGEIGYHLVFVRDEEIEGEATFDFPRGQVTEEIEIALDDDVGILFGGLTAGYRF